MQHVITGIDIGTTTTRVVVCEIGPNGSLPVISSGSVQTAGVRKGHVTESTAATRSLQKALYQAQQAAGLSALKQATVAVGGTSLQSHRVRVSVNLGEDPRSVNETDLSRLQEKTLDVFYRSTPNRYVLHVIPQQYRVDKEVYTSPPISIAGNRLEVTCTVVHCLEHHARELYHAAEAVGINSVGLVASPLATGTAVLTPKQMTVGTLVIDIGSDTVTMAVFEEMRLVHTKVFAIGSDHITNDIALGFQITLDDAQNIKHGDFESTHHMSARKLETIVNARLADIFELIQKELKSIHKHETLPGGIVITGGGGLLGTVDQFAKDTLNLPSFKAKIQTLNAQTRKLPSISWLTAYGSCVYSVTSSQEEHRFNSRPIKRIWQRIRTFFEQFLP